MSTLKFGALEPSPGFHGADVPASFELRGAAIDVTAWTYRKPLSSQADGVQEIELDADVLAHAAADLRDLRIVQHGTQVPYVLERTDVTRSLQLEVAAANEPKRPTQSRWILKLPTPDVPLKTLTIHASTPLFRRHFRLLRPVTDERGKTESLLAEFVWTRESSANGSYTVTLPEAAMGSKLILETENGDNPGVSITEVKGAYRVVHLLFASRSRDLALHYGNDGATAPNYDLSLVASELLAADKAQATLGAEERTSSTNRWSWKSRTLSGGVLLWVAVGATVVVLLLVIARLLPKPPEPPV